MALDPRMILTAGNIPQQDLVGAVGRGLQLQQQIARAPLVQQEMERQMLENQLAIENAPILAAQRRQEASQQQIRNDISLAQEQMRARTMAEINFSRRALSLPEEQRSQFIQSLPEDQLSALGFSREELAQLPTDDETLQRIINDGRGELSGVGGGNVQSSVNLPGGLTKIVTRDGRVKVIDASGNRVNPDRAALAIEEAERRKIDLARDKVIGTETGKRIAATSKEVINSGREAAKGIPRLRRSIDLLNEVRTSGINAIALRAQDFFGVAGANAAELSSNLGEVILGDLKETFGAQFTEKEGAKLERIRASFGKSAEGNKRLLNQALQIAESSAKRAIKRAVEDEDFATAAEIKEMMELDLSPIANEREDGAREESAAIGGIGGAEVGFEAGQQQSVQEGTIITNRQTGQRLQLRNNQWVPI